MRRRAQPGGRAKHDGRLWAVEAGADAAHLAVRKLQVFEPGKRCQDEGAISGRQRQRQGNRDPANSAGGMGMTDVCQRQPREVGYGPVMPVNGGRGFVTQDRHDGAPQRAGQRVGGVGAPTRVRQSHSDPVVRGGDHRARRRVGRHVGHQHFTQRRGSAQRAVTLPGQAVELVQPAGLGNAQVLFTLVAWHEARRRWQIVGGKAGRDQRMRCADVRDAGRQSVEDIQLVAADIDRPAQADFRLAEHERRRELAHLPNREQNAERSLGLAIGLAPNLVDSRLRVVDGYVVVCGRWEVRVGERERGWRCRLECLKQSSFGGRWSAPACIGGRDERREDA